MSSDRAAGPFVVTHRRAEGLAGVALRERVLSVKAVADLDAAQRRARDLIVALPGYDENHRGWAGAALDALLIQVQEGGTVSLPDGSEIHVEATTQAALIEEVERDGGLLQVHERRSVAVVCAVWNSRFGVSQEKGGER